MIQNPGVAVHPMHLHGHNFFVLAVGTGTWDGQIIVNAASPLRRDVQLVPAGGYLVIQITADSPSAWLLYCHIAWHVSAGLYVTRFPAYVPAPLISPLFPRQNRENTLF
jgi:FtsP/CotA-like multicopper oxidase with cupredoxin domain